MLVSYPNFLLPVYEPGRPHTIPVLTAHVYYRALLTIPSLIHAWVSECKDRQLTNIVTTYTSTYFSPVLIRTELEHVRSHATSDGLIDDSMSIKVAGAVNEVVAAYSVDDHQLEIKIKIPVDWPLHKVEVRDVKRVGVDESRWRGWVLGVQQIIWAHVSCSCRYTTVIDIDLLNNPEWTHSGRAEHVQEECDPAF